MRKDSKVKTREQRDEAIRQMTQEELYERIAFQMRGCQLRKRKGESETEQTP